MGVMKPVSKANMRRLGKIIKGDDVVRDVHMLMDLGYVEYKRECLLYGTGTMSISYFVATELGKKAYEQWVKENPTPKKNSLSQGGLGG
jgi:hypothetical protein